MNYAVQLREAADSFQAARRAAARREARRDQLIRRAYDVGGMSTREIGAIVGLSYQRVSVVIGGGVDRPIRPTLHGAMEQVLREHGGDWMPVHEIAREIHERELYRRRDREVIASGQVRARAAKYAELFEGSNDRSNTIRLRGAVAR